MTRRFLLLTLLLAMQTGCPHAWRRGGTIDQAVLKDIIENSRKDGCDPDEVLEQCGLDGFDECMGACESAQKRDARK